MRAARTAAGLTQKDLAGRLGIAAPNIAAYESGKRALSEDLFDRILDATRPLPSTTLRAHARQVKELAARRGADSVSVFGSVAAMIGTTATSTCSYRSARASTCLTWRS